MGPEQQAQVLALVDVQVTVTGPVPAKVPKDDTLTAWFRTRNRPVPDLTDDAWAKAGPICEAASQRTRSNALDHRQALSAILHKARTSCSWTALPSEYGSHRSVVTRYQRWVADGVWDELMDVLEGLPGKHLPEHPYPLPTLTVEGRVDPRLLVGIGATPQESRPRARVKSQGNSYAEVSR
jgi:hypothetical protein